MDSFRQIELYVKKSTLLLLLIPAFLGAENPQDSLIKTGLNAAYNLEFSTAFTLLNTSISQDPENPKPYYFRSSAYYWLSVVCGSDSIEKVYESMLDTTLRITKNTLKMNKHDLNTQFYLGCTYNNISRFYLLKRKWIKAYWYGKKSMKILSNLIAQDSSYYDAYTFVGLYHYFADVLPKYIKTIASLTGIKGDRKRGLAELTLAINRSNFTQIEAMLFYLEIMIKYEKNMSLAIPILNNLIHRFPSNIFLLLYLVDYYHYHGNYMKASPLIQDILASQVCNRFTLYKNITLYKLGELYFLKNEFDSAITAYNRCFPDGFPRNKNHHWVYLWAKYRVGECYDLLGDRQKALFHYQQVLKHDKGRVSKKARMRINHGIPLVEAARIKGFNWAKVNKYDQARKIFQDALKTVTWANEKYPPSAITDLYFYLGKIEYDRKNYSEAISTFSYPIANQLPMKRKTLSRLHFWLGQSYLQMGDQDKADEYLQKVR